MSEPDVPPGTLTEPVTVVVTRRVKPDRRRDYEHWLRRFVADAATLPGHLGTQVTPPPEDAADPEYVSVFRFDSVEHLREFERSDLRGRYLDEVADMVRADAVWDTQTGLEFWFAPPPGTVVAQPSRFRMALLLIVLVYTLVLGIGGLAAAVFAGIPSQLRLFLVVAIEVLLLTYVIMPPLTRALARWLYPRKVRA